MSTNQLFFAIATLFLAGLGFFKYYIDAKIDPLAKNIDRLIDYMIQHEGKIIRLEERTK